MREQPTPLTRRHTVPGRRIGVVYPRATLDSVPCLANAVDLLAGRGYPVDVFTYEPPDGTPPALEPGAQLVSLGRLADGAPPAAVGQALRRAPGLRRFARPLRPAYAALRSVPSRISALASHLAVRAHVRRVARTDGYRCFLGVDPDGLVLAQRLSRGTGAPVAYQSLELLLSKELTTPAERRLKRQEVALSRQAPFVIVQDERRARLLADDNGLNWDRIALVPNAPLGPARRQPSSYWRDRFALPPGTRVVLHSGSLGAWTGIEAIVASVPSWPPGWVLVVHTRYSAESSAYVAGLRAASDPARVFFSLSPVPRHEYDRLVDGAGVGIAFYVPDEGSAFTGANIQTIGFSSGKIASYARGGLPMVVNDASTIGEVLESAACGVSVSGGPGIAAALARIEAAYPEYSQRACAFFDDRLDFARAFEDVLRRIEALDGRS